MSHRHSFTFESLGLERSKPLETLAFFLLLVFVVVAPLQWGAVLPAGKLKIELFAFAIAALLLASRAPLGRLRVVMVPAGALALLAIAGVLQLVPLGAETVETVAPFSARVHADTNAILATHGRAPVPMAISIAPYETRSAALLIAAYASLFVSSVALLGSRNRRRTFVAVVILTAVVFAIVATASFGSRAAGRVSGPFVNPNHFAGWLEIALALAFGVLWREVLFSRERGRGGKDGTPSMERSLVPIAIAVLAWGVVAIGIGLTKSRGGVGAAAITTVALTVAAILHQRLDRRTRLALTLGAVLLCAVGLTALVARDEPLLRLLESDPREIGADTRVALWRASIDAWMLSPHAGTGLGTFREAFRHVQPREINELVEQAHSDPLQLLVTGGWIGFALGAIAVVSTLVILVRLWRRQPHREEAAFTLAGIGALGGLLVHGLVEFNFSIPSIPATLACVAGMAIAAGMHGRQVTLPRSHELSS